MQDFKEYMHQRELASRAFVNGDSAPLLSVSTHVSPATIYGPSGNTIEGADNVNAANVKGAQGFGPGSVTQFEIQQMSANADLTFWAGDDEGFEQGRPILELTV
jgi:hypothetical protein